MLSLASRDATHREGDLVGGPPDSSKKRQLTTHACARFSGAPFHCSLRAASRRGFARRILLVRKPLWDPLSQFDSSQWTGHI